MNTTTQGIGDLTSTEKGSGARFNAGKPPVELLPLEKLALYYSSTTLFDSENEISGDAIEALQQLGQFQAGGDARHLHAVIDLFKRFIPESAHVFDYGRGKYAEWNWAKGMPWSVPIACAARHLEAIIHGEWTDAESGRHHAGHVLCNVWMLLVYMDNYTQGDDRPGAMLSGGVPTQHLTAELDVRMAQLGSKLARCEVLMLDAALVLNQLGSCVGGQEADKAFKMKTQLRDLARAPS